MACHQEIDNPVSSIAFHQAIDDPVKLSCSMACGKISSCPFSDQMIAEAREAWLDSLADSVSQKEELVEINACQPFLLKAVGKRCG
jgi:hypothetical protein